ncbi:MAG: pyroglutamyl-peptidase I [Bacillota bacterium]
MGKVLLTGFDPFNEEKVNPAGEVIKRLAGREISGYELDTLEVPTVRQKSLRQIEAKIDEISPDMVISIGQAGGRAAISVERVAINIDDYRIEDNEANSPVDRPINPDGPAAYFATLPIKAMVKAVQDIGIPAEVSNTAGTFVCNHVMYGVLDFIARKNLDILAGFIHIPFLPAQVVDKPKKPSMPLTTLEEGITQAIQAAIEYQDGDIEYAAGKTN